VDEGSVHPCVINGKDYGQLLYTLGVMGWLMLVTLPAGAFVFVSLADRPSGSSLQLAQADVDPSLLTVQPGAVGSRLKNFPKSRMIRNAKLDNNSTTRFNRCSKL
jgi:hypothetical protein